MIDFTDLEPSKKGYTGSHGKKIAVIYNGNRYMLKFPCYNVNGCLSEYLGSNIFKSLGFDVQETLLGTYRINNKEKIVVACKDICINGFELQDFASLKNTLIDYNYSCNSTELDNVLTTIEHQHVVDVTTLSSQFWNMFVVDALIGNGDRHNGNWGFLYKQDNDEIKLAPIYDCGSCLFPQLDETIMQKVIGDQSERDYYIYDNPLSVYKVNGKKIGYFDFISSLSNEDCNKALLRIVPKINLETINNIIDKTPLATSLQKEFYKTILTERKKRILDFSYEKLVK